MTDVDLDSGDTGPLERGRGHGDALRVSREPRMPDQLAARLHRLSAPAAERGAVEEHRSRVAEAERRPHPLELGGDHPGDAHGALPDQGKQAAVGVHEAEELGLETASHAGRHGLERLHQRGGEVLVAPGGEGVDEGFGHEPTALCRRTDPIGETARAAPRRTLQGAHMGEV